MLLEILNVVAPVFIVVGAGYLAVRSGFFTAAHIDQLMKFAIQIAVPCLLFRAASTIDLAAAFDWRLLTSYYGSSIICFVIGFVIVRYLFKRRPGEAVAVAFSALFSNLVLLGLPISERAFGVASQFGARKVDAYGFGRMRGIDYEALDRASQRAVPIRCMVLFHRSSFSRYGARRMSRCSKAWWNLTITWGMSSRWAST